MVEVKRESWKGKTVFVARDEKGRLKTWTRKLKTIESAREQFRKTGTFKENVLRKEFRNFIEYTERQDAEFVVNKKEKTIQTLPKRIRRARRDAEIVQYVVTITIKNETLSARSNAYDDKIKGADEMARAEAWRNILEVLSGDFAEDYSVASGKSFLLMQTGYTIKEGKVYYVRRKMVKTN